MEALVAIALGVTLGLVAYWYRQRQPSRRPGSAEAREPLAVSAESPQTRAAPRSTSGAAPAVPAERGEFVPPAYEAPWKASAVPLPTMDATESRDEAWATEMERSISAFSRENLATLFPNARWSGVQCYSTFCEMTYAVPMAESVAAKHATLLLVGVGVRVLRSADEPVDGEVTQHIRYRMTDPETGARTSGAEFAESQRAFAERFPERVAAIRAGVELDRAAPP